MNTRAFRVALLVLVGGGAAGGAAWWWQSERAQPASSLVLHGNVDIRQVELAFNSSARIEQMLAHEGDRVQKGQLLAVLDTRRLKIAVAQAEAQVAAQRQVVARNEAGSRPEEIRKARADAEAARVDAINAERIHRRQLELVAQHFVSQQQADNAKADAEAARAKVKSADETLRLVRAGPRKEDIEAARATLRAFEEAAAIARRDLEEASLYAPSAGVIQNRVLEPGDMASPQKPVYTLALDEPLWVRAYLSEPDLGKVRPGMIAAVSTDSFPDKRYRAWVGFVSPTAEFTPKSVETREVRTALVYQVRVFVCPPHEELRLGMPATVTIPFDQPAPAPQASGAEACKKAP